METVGFDMSRPSFGLGQPGTPTRTTVPVRVDPPKPQPASERRLQAGVWGGRTTPASGAPQVTDVTFRVGADGRITDLRASAFETCTVAAGSRQGGSVTSLPRRIGLQISGPITPSTGTFPKFAQFAFSRSGIREGTTSIRIGSGQRTGLTFADERSVTGTVEAYRVTDGGVAGTRCSTTFSFTARAGQSASPGDAVAYRDG
jgi:hypothetical protein